MNAAIEMMLAFLVVVVLIFLATVGDDPHREARRRAKRWPPVH